MDKCKKCSKKFGWKTIVKSTIISSVSPVICDSCKSENYPKFSNYLITSFSIGLPLIVMNHFDSRFEFYNILSYILWATFVMVLSPFYAKFYIKDKIV